MKINLYIETSPWIMNRCAAELYSVFKDCEINSSRTADWHYFLPYTTFKKIPESGKIAAFFTHIETAPGEESRKKATKFFQVFSLCDYAICMNATVFSKLIFSDQRKENCQTELIRPGTNLKKEITFGVCGKVHSSGRKGESLIAELSKEYKFLAWGSGWPCKIFSDKLPDLPHFYEKIDYLVVSSIVEGGPIPVIEALASGVPVIAPNVGWCWEYPVIRYESQEQLRHILRDLSNPPTWGSWRARHLNLFHS